MKVTEEVWQTVISFEPINGIYRSEPGGQGCGPTNRCFDLVFGLPMFIEEGFVTGHPIHSQSFKHLQMVFEVRVSVGGVTATMKQLIVINKYRKL
jgi:hypothetical protein